MKFKGDRSVNWDAHLLRGRAKANFESVFWVEVAWVGVRDFYCSVGGVAPVLPSSDHPVDLEDTRLGAVIDRMDRMDLSGGEMEFFLTVKFSYLRGERERRGWGAVFRIFKFNFNRCPDAKVLVFLRFRILFLKIKDVSPIIVKND